MDYRLNDEQIAMRDKYHVFARDVIRPVAQLHDREQSIPWDVMKQAQKEDINTITAIATFQMDPDGLMSAIYSEELHWGCAGIALSITGSMLAAAGIASSGTPEQVMEWVPQCFGEGDTIRLGAYGVTEAGAGSDVKSLRTTAKLDGDEWVLNGTKVFITNGGIADVTVIVATVDAELGHRGQASFIVPKDTPGFTQGKKEDKLGIRASHTAEVICDNCRIPAEYLLGGMDKLNKKLERARAGQQGGSSNALATFELTRPFVGASALGIARASYEGALDYLADKHEGGKPVLEQQGYQQVLADVATEIEASRLLVWHAAWMGRNGMPMTGGQGSMSKLKAGDTAMWATTRLMDLIGPEASSTDLQFEKWLRDAKIYQIFEGTAQVQRLVISRLQVAEHKRKLEEARDLLKAAADSVPASATREPADVASV